MSELRKRLYKIVDVSDAGEIRLDGRTVKTPGGQALCITHKPLAEAIAAEWAAQEEQINPDTMPLTQIAITKIDRVAHERAAMASKLLAYLHTDLLCYCAEDPPEIVELQTALWDPPLSWFADRFGAELQTTTGLAALTQSADATKAVSAYVEALDDDHFTALQIVSSAAGSLVLGLALLEAAMDEAAIFNAARLEEQYYATLYKADQYGPDPMHEKQEKSLRADLESVVKYLGLLSS